MKYSFNRLGILVLVFSMVSCQKTEQTSEKPKVKYDIPKTHGKKETTYLLISHADAAGEQIHKNTELSEKGFEQAAFWGDYFSDKEIDLFYTSTETFAFQTMIPIVHPYKGQIRNIDKQLSFNNTFWNNTYGQKSIIISSDQQNIDFVNDILQYDKYKLKDIKDKTYLFKVHVNKDRQIKDTLNNF